MRTSAPAWTSRGARGQHALLNHLIRTHQQRRRDRQPECLRGLQIDDEVELCRLLHGQVCRLGALQDSVNVDCSTSFHLGSIYSIGHEATWLDEILELIDCGDPVRGRKIDDLQNYVEPGGLMSYGVN